MTGSSNGRERSGLRFALKVEMDGMLLKQDTL